MFIGLLVGILKHVLIIFIARLCRFAFAVLAERRCAVGRQGSRQAGAAAIGFQSQFFHGLLHSLGEMRCLLATVWSPVCQVRTPLTPVSRDLVGVDEMRDLFDLFVFFLKKKSFGVSLSHLIVPVGAEWHEAVGRALANEGTNHGKAHTEERSRVDHDQATDDLREMLSHDVKDGAPRLCRRACLFLLLLFFFSTIACWGEGGTSIQPRKRWSNS